MLLTPVDARRRNCSIISAAGSASIPTSNAVLHSSHRRRTRSSADSGIEAKPAVGGTIAVNRALPPLEGGAGFARRVPLE